MKSNIDLLKKISPYILISSLLLIFSFFNWGYDGDYWSSWPLVLNFYIIQIPCWSVFGFSVFLLLYKILELLGLTRIKFLEMGIYIFQILVMIGSMVFYFHKFSTGLFISLLIVLFQMIKFVRSKEKAKSLKASLASLA